MEIDRKLGGMIDSRVKLRHLQAVVAIAQEGSVQSAARSLARTPPAISKALNELEDLIGKELFRRTRRGLVPTEAGDQLTRHLVPSLGMLGVGLDLASGRDRQMNSFRVRIGILPTVASAVVPLAIQDVRMRHPKFSIRICSGTNVVLLNQLREGDLDLVVGRLPDPATMFGLTFETLYSEPLVFAARPDHPLLLHPSLCVADCAAYPLILPLPDSTFRRSVESFLLQSGIRDLPMLIETSSELFSRALIDFGDAIWVYQMSVIRRDVLERRLALLPVDTSATNIAIGMSVRADVALRGNTLAVMNAIRHQAHSWRSSADWPAQMTSD